MTAHMADAYIVRDPYQNKYSKRLLDRPEWSAGRKTLREFLSQLERQSSALGAIFVL
jgi:hypothetical protein